MQLILAIDGDARRAEQLAGLVRGKLAVELVQASSAGDGLQALGDRVPDLIITSPLLSPFDDGVLAEYLRGLGSAAAHVQTLRIPVFATAPKPLARRLFSLRRRKPAQVIPGGCDPAVFADEIGVYLQRAAEEQGAALAAQAPEPSDAPAEHPANEPFEPTASGEPSWASRFEPPPAPIEEPALSYVPFTAAASDASIAPPDAPEAPPAFDPLPDPVAERLAALRPVIADPALERAVSALEGAIPAAPPPAPYYGQIPVDRAPVHTLSVDADPIDVPEIDTASPATPEPGFDMLIVEPPPAAPITVAAKPSAVLRPNAAQPDATPAGTRDAIAETDGASPVALTTDPISPVSLTPAATFASVVHDAAVPIAHAEVGEDAVAGTPSSGHVAADAPATTTGPVAAVEPPPVPPAAAPAAPVTVQTTPSFEAALAAIRAAWGRPAQKTARAHASVEPTAAAPDRVDTDAPAAVPETAAATPPPATAEPALVLGDDVREVADAVADLAAAPPADVPASRPAPVAPLPQVPRKRAERTRARAGRPRLDKGHVPPGRPLQDEWGIFDPNQCGFSAVVDKLDEVTDTGRPERTTVRVISFS